jgi:hypothetical protein
MAFFDDMTAAVASYPQSDVDLEIVDVTTPGDAFNVNETGNFRVKVTNRGPLNMTDVTLKIRALNGATVANNGILSPFESEFVTQEMPLVAAHGGSQLTVGSPLKVKAPGSPQPSANLVRATLEDWNCNVDHILGSHSDPVDNPRAVYAAEVVAA